MISGNEKCHKANKGGWCVIPGGAVVGGWWISQEIISKLRSGGQCNQYSVLMNKNSLQDKREGAALSMLSPFFLKKEVKQTNCVLIKCTQSPKMTE